MNRGLRPVKRSVRIGNAPVSYGAFEVTVGHDANVPAAGSVLDAVAGAGYEGVDLGPLGYLGTGRALYDALASRNLLLTGGYVEIDVSSADPAAAGLDELARVCDQFDAVSTGVDGSFLPRPTVAFIAPGMAGEVDTDASLRSRVHRGVEAAVELCAERGYNACVHNEVGTCIATHPSVVALMEGTSASLCLDSGHLVAAGGDPVAIVERWSTRVDHVHLKDARADPGTPQYREAMDLWETGVFCRLGAGTGQVGAVLNALKDADYRGWIVVEQDVLPRDAAAYARAAEDQVANRRYLAERGW